MVPTYTNVFKILKPLCMLLNIKASSIHITPKSSRYSWTTDSLQHKLVPLEQVIEPKVQGKDRSYYLLIIPQT